jgi:hypothetical protein
MMLNPRALRLDPAAAATFARGTKATAKLHIMDWRVGGGCGEGE